MTAAAPTGKSLSKATELRLARRGRPKPEPTSAPAPAGVTTLAPIAIDNIAPSTFNPRKNFDEAALEELAASIRQVGVLQPIVVRERHYLEGPEWEIVAGERRWRAAKLAGLQAIHAVMLEAGGAAAALQAAIVENVQRQDLSPIEMADAIQALIDTGMTQAKAAEAIGLKGGQSRAAHLLKLRELPEAIRALLSDGKLSAAHGEALARWSDFPAFALALAQAAVEEDPPLSAREIAKPFDNTSDVLNDDRFESLYDQVGAEVIKRANCQECPWKAFVPGHSAYWGHCLRPDHHAEIIEQLKAGQRERNSEARAEAGDLVAAAIAAAHTTGPISQAEASKLATAALPKLEVGDRIRHNVFGDGSILESKPSGVLIKPDSGEKEFWTGLNAFGGGKIQLLDENGHATTHTAELPPIVPVPALRDMRYDTYEQLRSDAPTICKAGTCACYGKARDYSGAVVAICTSPRRLRSLQNQATRARNAENERRQVEAVSRVEDYVRDHTAAVTARDLALVLFALAAPPEYRPQGTHISEVWTEAARWLKGKKVEAPKGVADLDKLIDGLPSDQLLKALVDAICRQDLALRFHSQGNPRAGALAAWYVQDKLPERAPADWQPKAEKTAKREKAAAR